MKKRILLVALCLCMMLTLLPAEAIAAEWQDIPPESDQPLALDIGLGELESNPPTEESEPDGSQDTDAPRTGTNSGTCGDNLTWELSDDGTLTISGTGNMEDYREKNYTTGSTSPWFAYAPNIKGVVLEEGVTSIGNYAFYDCTNLVSATIPEGVTRIGERAFSYCGNLTSVNIPNGVTYIGFWAFSNCRNLTNVTIPASATRFSESAFVYCDKLTSAGPLDGDYNIKFGWTDAIPPYVFENCGSLTSVAIPEGITSIGFYAFCRTGLTSVTLPSTLTDIENYAFYDSGIKEIIIPNGVTLINSRTFGSSLTTVVIPASVTTIEAGSFAGGSEPKNIIVDENNPNYCAIGNVLFSKDQTALISYCAGGTGHYTVPDTVTRIESCAFSECRLTELSLPDDLTYIGPHAFEYSSLTTVNFPDSMTAIPDLAFSGCAFTSFVVPEGIETIGEQVFVNCSELASVALPESLTTIKNGAFCYCHSLKSITIPAKVTSITWPFRDCTSLTEIIVAEDNPAYCSVDGVLFTKDMTTLVAYPAGKSGSTYKIPDSVTEIDRGAFAMNRLTTIDIPKNVKTIGDYAFEHSTLTSLKIPSSVKTLERDLFWACSQLSSIEIPDSVTTIPDRLFSDCSRSLVISCYAGSAIMEYAIKNDISYKVIPKPGRTLSVSVTDPDGEAFSSGFTVIWYDEDEHKIGTSPTLFGADMDKNYSFEIILTGDLAKRYQQPERQTIKPEDDAVCTVRLVEKPPVKTLILSGHVADHDGVAILGAAVTVMPAGGDLVEVSTGADGGFSADVPYGIVSITIRMDGYYSKRETLDLTAETGDTYNTGIYTLAPVQVITDRVTLSVTQLRAAEKADGAMEFPLSSLGAMDISITGKDSTDFEVQGLTVLFKPGAVQAGEEITVTITDPSGAYRTASGTVELDGNRLGSVELTMMQKGSLVLGGLSGPSANLLLFDSKGNCILTRAATPGLSSGTLEAGAYRAVLIQKSELLRGVSALNYLDAFGLREGQDYLLREISITDSYITRLADCTVPTLDENRISYTIAENTGVSTSKPSGVSAGEMLMVRAAYELDKAKGVTAESLQIVLPEGVSQTGTSATIDGKTVPYTYDVVKREVKISTAGRDKAVVWLCCTPETSGSHSISAYLALSNGASQPIGAAVVQAENAKLNVPERTGKAEGLTASGKTMPGCAVTLYDNDVEVGTVTANAAGSWSMEFDLTQPVYSYSYHNIYAAISGGTLTKPIQTEGVLVTYDKRLDVELTKITMYNTGDHGAQETVFDFTNPSTAAPYYRMWPSRYPTFTFKAKFSGDASNLSDVHVVTTNSAGDKTYVKMQYDAADGAWVGTHDYTSFNNAPVVVTAAYRYGDSEGLPYDADLVSDTEISFTKLYKEIEDSSAKMEEFLGCEDLVIDNDGLSLSAKMTFTDPNTGETKPFGTYQLKIEEIVGALTDQNLTNQGYLMVDNNECLWWKTEYTENTKASKYIDLDKGIVYSETIRTDQPHQKALRLSVQSSASGYSWEETSRSIATILSTGTMLLCPPAGVLADSMKMHLENSSHVRMWSRMMTGNVEILQTYLNTAELLLAARCKTDGSLRVPRDVYISAQNEIYDIGDEIARYSEVGFKLIKNTGINKIMNNALTSSVGLIIGKYVEYASSQEVGAGFLGMIYSLLDNFKTVRDGAADIKASIQSVKNPTEQYIIRTYNDIYQEILMLSQRIRASYTTCNAEEDQATLPAGQAQPISKPATMIADPSGYVYEAVPSNRLEVVTAVISGENGGEWNAASYDQINPQVTGADGGYYWDVPQGNWKVSFTKAGYENADTSQVEAAVGGWLPVPPPQLEVNVGMVSTAAPTVKQAAAYTDRVEVEFSQYMDIASVQGALSLIQNSAALSGCTVEALDAEYNLENTAQYATRFAITPSDTGILSDGLVVSVSTGAKNYAGKALVSAYASKTLRASVRPTGIEVENTVSVGLHKEVGLPLTLQPGVAVRELVVENLSPNLIGTAGTVTTGADGTATVSISGILPGSGIIRITEPVSGLSTTVSVSVSFDGAGEEVSVLPVEAILKDGRTVTDGMTIPRNTEITLQTNTPGAVIRYTLNDTCPCTQESLTYSEPIIIDSSTVLRAAAYKNGVYSTTIRLHLNAENSGETHTHNWEAAWSNDADGHWHVCTCGAKSDFAAHTEDGGKVTIAATAYQDGERTYSCTVCEYVIRTERIPATGGGSHGGGSSSGGGGNGSSSGSTYSVSVSSRILNGTVRISPSSVQKGDTVTITVTPNTGYKLDKLTVSDSKGNKVTVREQSNGKLTFTMPADKVTVDATFVKIKGTPTQPTGPSISFTDVTSSAYYADAVSWAVEKGITVGTSATTFSPDAPCTRAQIVTFLWRAAGSPSVGGSNPFTDVAPDSYYYDAVQWAVAQGITVGTSATTFSPDATCTRGQTVTFFYRYEKSPAVSGGNAFTDVPSDAYYADAVQWAVNNGVTSGTTATTFSPDSICTRGQIVTFLYRDMA